MDLSRGGTIADPIHGYVYFTGLERAILSHRIAQRLRYISQNGLAHLVFPEMRTSRFSHSLGTMHLSSAFLTSCLRNTAERTREQLASGIANAVREAVVIADVRRAAVSFGSPNLYAAHHVRADMSPEITLAEQSLRLAALFHDLGHLPFSHDFENGLEELFRMLNGEERDKLRPLIEQRPGEGKIHERIGHELALLLLKELFPQVRKTDQGEAALITFELAYKILEAAGPPTQNASGYALAWLHSLIDGDLDADRCDYILRDARNYGFEFASYDATRLLDNLAVADDGSSFFTVIRPPGLSALESFFVARYRSYQYGVRHHKVAQVGAALRHSIGRILAAGTAANFLNDLVQIVTGHGQGSLGRFALYDDIWWMSVMKRQCEADDDQWLRLVCWREPGPISVWKRISDFPAESISDWNSDLPDSANLSAQAQWWDSVSRLKEDGVLVVRHLFEPWKKRHDSDESVFSVVLPDGSISAASELSPMIRALSNSWANDIQVHAFQASIGRISPQEILQRLRA